MLTVGVRADRIVDLTDHVLDAEDLLRDLGGHQVAVVALGQREERVGLVDARLALYLEIRAVPEQRGALERRRKVLKGHALQVDDGHVVPTAIQQSCEERTNPATADNNDLQPTSS